MKLLKNYPPVVHKAASERQRKGKGPGRGCQCFVPWESLRSAGLTGIKALQTGDAPQALSGKNENRNNCITHRVHGYVYIYMCVNIHKRTKS